MQGKFWQRWRTRLWQDNEEAAIFEQTLSRTYHHLAASVADRQSLIKLFVEELPTTLVIAPAVLLLVEGNTLVATDGLTLPINHTAVRLVAASGEATLVRAELQKLIDQGRTDLGWSRLWIPLMRGANLYGLWLLGRRQQDQPYSSDHCRWLTTLARHAALILETVRVAEAEQARAQQLQSLYQQTVTASEQERGRLSRELHDGVLQDLCALARDLKAIHSSVQPAGQPDSAPLEPLLHLTDEAINSLRAICHNLRPPLLTNNLPLALQALVERLNRQSRTGITFKSSCEALNLPEETTLALYRITQEALTNALQHANASEILVRLTQYPAALRLTISDDGCGLPSAECLQWAVEAGHFGLVSMRERARMIGATLEIQSAKEYGTAVIVLLALKSGTHCDDSLVATA